MSRRKSGILMHITSLPNKFGIGSFGQSAYDFVDFLAETKQSYWQLLPLTTTSYGDSPYQSFSAIAGNTHLIDFDLLEKDGVLDKEDYQKVSFGSKKDRVDYARVFEKRRPILEKAVKNFVKKAKYKKPFQVFEKENESWLQDYAEFMALKEHFNHVALQEWPDRKAILREEEALEYYRKELADRIIYHKVCQYFFFKQWHELKDYANKHHIEIIGDIPIYVSADSVEVWTMPKLFKLNKKKDPLYVAGVPADDFSADGQYWGNPIYNWSYHKRTKYAWWVYRIKESFKLYDVLRVDHFKGFSDYWQVDAREETAKNGTWEAGPGYDLFKIVKQELGDLPIIAENLGYIDDKAKLLLKKSGFPGMKIMEFGFYDVTGASLDLPHYFDADQVAYTGTHDNEVVNGWYQNLTTEQQQFVDEYTHRAKREPITQAMLRTLYASVADTAIASMQDVLNLGEDSRMNVPNTVGTNWQWRMKSTDLKSSHKEFLAKITKLYKRENEKNG